MADSFIRTGASKYVLIIGVERLSDMTDLHDRSTAFIFADGAGAVVLVGTGEPTRVGPIVMGADGSGAENIRVPRDPARIEMAGHETFKEAVTKLSESTEQAAAAAGRRPTSGRPAGGRAGTGGRRPCRGSRAGRAG